MSESHEPRPPAGAGPPPLKPACVSVSPRAESDAWSPRGIESWPSHAGVSAHCDRHVQTATVSGLELESVMPAAQEWCTSGARRRAPGLVSGAVTRT